MNAIRRQGVIFVAASLLLSGYHLAIGLPGGANTLVALTLLIVLLGVPHGALDTLYAGWAFRIRRPSQWLLFTIAYLLPVAAVLLLWPYAPAFFLLLFVTVSISHFSGDPEPGCPRWLRVVYGGSPVVLPALLQGVEVERLFAALVPAGAAANFHTALAWVAWPWLVALALGAVRLARRDRQGALEIAAAGTLCCLAPPLVSFTLFFCGMHSARHILRSVEASAQNQDATASPARLNAGQVTLAGLPPMIATLGILAIYWTSAGQAALEPRLLQTVFIGLAALTFPHVVLVDWCYRRVRNDPARVERMPGTNLPARGMIQREESDAACDASRRGPACRRATADL